MAQLDQQSRPNDAELVQACCNGRAEAFQTLVERYQDRIYNTVFRLVNFEEDARDIVQDAFFKAYETLPRFRGDSSFYTWIFRIAVNAALSHRRKNVKLRLVKSLDDPHGPDLSQTQAGRLADPPEKNMETLERQRIVTEAIARLDPDHRAALVLRDMEGLDYTEISTILDVPPGTVKSRIHRARMILRERLQDVIM